MLEKTSPGARLGQSFPRPVEAAESVAMARRDLNKALPRRFYKDVSTLELEGTAVLLLDGHIAKSAGGNNLALPALAAARALASEWSAQGEVINLASMPLTRIVNSAIDGVAPRRDATVNEIARYAGADLVCYRAAGPRTLVEAQAAAWDSILAFAREKLGACFICTEGVMFGEQPGPARAAVTETIKRIANSGPAASFALAALHVMATLTGSVLIALALAHGELTSDEDFEMRTWGEDAEALRRRARQWREMEAAAVLWQLTMADVYPGA